jgi:drug/metabolite transporter (DMT)-like permease
MTLALVSTRGSAGPSDLIGVLRVDGVLLPLICLGLFGSLVALGILNLYQRHLEPVRAAIIYTLEPVWATLYGLVLGLVGWTPWILVGGGLLVVGNLLVEVTSQDEEE